MVIPSRKGGGSGVFVDHEGRLLTNAHVAKNRQDSWSKPGHQEDPGEYRYLVKLSDRAESCEADYIGYDPARDLALLQVKGIKADEYAVLPISKEGPMVGETVYAVGTPLDLEGTMTKGIVSALHRVIGLSYLEDEIQVDPPINPGNSGGALVNEYGELVGVVNAKCFSFGSRSTEGLGFAIPIRLFDKEALMKGVVETPDVGIDALVETPQLTPWLYDLVKIREWTEVRNAEALRALRKALATHSALVLSVKDGSPAFAPHDGGVKRGDIIVKWGGVPIGNGMSLRFAMAGSPRGEPINVELLRPHGEGLVGWDVTVTIPK